MAQVPAMSVRIASNPLDSSGEDYVPEFVEQHAQWFGETQEVGQQQWDTRDTHQGGGGDNGSVPSDIPAEGSPSPTQSRPAEAVDGDEELQVVAEFGSAADLAAACAAVEGCAAFTTDGRLRAASDAGLVDWQGSGSGSCAGIYIRDELPPTEGVEGAKGKGCG